MWEGNVSMASPIPPQTLARNDIAQTGEDSPININVLANDRGGPSIHLYSLNQKPTGPVETTATTALGATITTNSDGTISYDPTQSSQLQALNSGQTADDTFNYTIQLGAGVTSTATVTVHVTGDDDTGRTTILDTFTGNTAAAGIAVFSGQSVAIAFTAPFTGNITSVTAWMGALFEAFPVTLGIEPDAGGVPADFFLNSATALTIPYGLDSTTGAYFTIPLTLSTDWPIVEGQEYWLVALTPAGGPAWTQGNATGSFAAFYDDGSGFSSWHRVFAPPRKHARGDNRRSASRRCGCHHE